MMPSNDEEILQVPVLGFRLWRQKKDLGTSQAHNFAMRKNKQLVLSLTIDKDVL